MAIAGRGFFVVQDTSGNQFFTRNGQVGLNAEGELITRSGLKLTQTLKSPWTQPKSACLKMALFLQSFRTLPILSP